MSPNRRDFIKQASSVTAGVALSASSYSKVLGANDRVNFGYIGMGGRMQAHTEYLAKRQKEKADYLRSEWEKKVKYFVYDDPYPFRSEYAFDRTAFESTYALAKYGATHDMKPDTNRRPFRLIQSRARP